MMKRLLVCLTCVAMMIAAIGHVSAMPSDQTGGDMTSTSHKVPLSQLSEPVSNHTLAQFGISMEGCIGHVHSASGGCTIDAVTSFLSFDPPHRISRVKSWIKTDSRLTGAALSPASPPPI